MLKIKSESVELRQTKWRWF